MAQPTDKISPERPYVGVWSRLEGRPRRVNFDRALRAEVHDALWMLTRQWQFGEFKGEDTGSAIFAKTSIKKSPLARTAYGDLNANNLQVEGYQSETPLEAKVESETIPFDLKMNQQITMYWRKLLKSKGIPKAIYRDFLTNYMLNDTIFSNDLEEADIKSDQKIWAQRFAMEHRTMNGEIFYQALVNAGSSGAASLVTVSTDSVAAGLVNEAGTELMRWIEQLYVQPEPGKNAWIGSRLEYQFGNAAPTAYNSKTALVAKEYHNGRLDWYSYDIEETMSSSHPLRNITPVPDEPTTSTTVPLTLIPTELRFGGMPVSRWWEFEDGYIDFGDLNAGTTEVPKIMMAEFALLYSNDWQVIPFTLPMGHLCKVEGITVTDVFGQKTNVGAANQGDDQEWQRWSIFNLAKQNEGAAAQADNQLLLPSTTPKIQEGKPIEQVRFIRDEMANMVWAIEAVVPNLMGEGRDAYAAFLSRMTYLTQLLDLDNSPQGITEAAKFIYRLSNNEAPENWIPFLPVRTPDTIREIKLQRGNLIRKKEGLPQDRILPYGQILTEQAAPYFINEEEIPRAGVEVTRSFQRTRWFDGKVVTWLGRRKSTGRGEGSSGLKYDVLTTE